MTKLFGKKTIIDRLGEVGRAALYRFAFQERANT